MEDGVTLRPVRAADAPAVEALYGTCAATEPGIGPVAAAQWLATVAQPQFGSGRDFLCAVHGGALVGLAESWLRDEGERRNRFAKLLVRPDRRRQNIGTALLRAVLDQGPAEATTVLHCLVRPSWTAALAFLARYGIAEVERELAMWCEALAATPETPVGVEIGGLDDPDAAAGQLAAVYNEAFRGSFGFVVQAAGDMRGHFPGAQVWAATVAGEVVAYAAAGHEKVASWLEIVAVAPPYQGRGIGAALAVAALRSDGAGPGRPAGLAVSSRNSTALHLYRCLGFSVRSEMVRHAALRDDVVARMAWPAVGPGQP